MGPIDAKCLICGDPFMWDPTRGLRHCNKCKAEGKVDAGLNLPSGAPDLFYREFKHLY